jgi:glutamyl-tRNA synthetase
MLDRPLRVRFAPSPTGSLHLGNARTALYNWLIARRTGGTFVVRIEDTDVDRHQEGAEAAIYEDLRWLGLDWDEGPDVGGSYGPYRQSERHERYAAAADALIRSSRSYRCFCTEARIEDVRTRQRAAGQAPRYDGHCRRIEAGESDRRAKSGEPFATRFRTIPAGADPEQVWISVRDEVRGDLEFAAKELGDPVLVRRDGRATYNFAVVVDDAAMEIDLVVRGDDHLSNTPRQVQLFEALGAPPPVFAHVPMVRGADGEKLSKRHGATSVAEYRRFGYPPEALLNALVLLGWGPQNDDPVLDIERMVREFDPARVSRSPSTFDPAKLDWLSSKHVQAMPVAILASRVSAALIAAGVLPTDAPTSAKEWVEGVSEMLRTKVERMDQVPDRANGLFCAGGVPSDADAREVLDAPGARDVVRALDGALADGEPADASAWKTVVDRVKNDSGMKGRGLYHPLRVAVTGVVAGPELDRLVPLVVAGHRVFPDHVPGLAARVRRTLAGLP